MLTSSRRLLSASNRLRTIPLQQKRFFRFKDGQRLFSRDEVGKHNTLTDGWVVYEDGVYNITTWIPYHPGGEKLLVPLLGKDVSVPFRRMQHSSTAIEELERHRIGVIETKRRYTCEYHGLYPMHFGEEGGFH